MRGELRQLQEGRPRVEQPAHALARQQLAARQVPRARALVAALLDPPHRRVQVLDQRAHRRGVRLERWGADIDRAGDDTHGFEIQVELRQPWPSRIGESSRALMVSACMIARRSPCLREKTGVREMGQLLVRNVDEDLIRRLKERAAAHGRSAEAEHRIILQEALCAGRGASRSGRRAGGIDCRPRDDGQRRTDPCRPRPRHSHDHRRCQRAVKWVFRRLPEAAASRRVDWWPTLGSASEQRSMGESHAPQLTARRRAAALTCRCPCPSRCRAHHDQTAQLDCSCTSGTHARIEVFEKARGQPGLADRVELLHG